jgi:hypothetical protein
VIKLTLRQANHPDTQVQVEGDAATIGRAAGSEVLIQQPYVSKRHVKLLKGWVVVDLGSSNGTFVDGKRIVEPTLLSGDEFQLGEGDVTVRVWRDEAGASARAGGGASGGSAVGAPVTSEELEKLRTELAERGEELAAAHAIVDRLHAKTEQLRAENQRLKGVPPPGPSDSTPAPSLATAPAPSEESVALGHARAQVGELTAERNQLLRDMEQERSDVERLTAAVARLEATRAEQRGEIARLEASVTASLTASATSLDELDRLRAENARLASEVEALNQRLASAPAASVPAGPMGELLIRLQAENSALKRQMSESGSSPAAANVASGARTQESPAKLLAELLELRAQNQALRAQSGQRAAPVPAQHIAPASGVAAVLQKLADDDIEKCAADYDAAPEEFVAEELFRVVRQVERVVTRVAGDHIQLYQSNTMLPNVEGNLRGLVATILGDATEQDARAELARYFEQLAKWLVAAMAANRKAAQLFAEKLKHDLSEPGLLAQAPIPAFRKLSGGTEAELWRRACAYLRELTPDMLDDALEKLSRDTVKELLGTSAP